MFTIEKTTKALIKKFEENNWKELKLNLKTGDTVWITPCPVDYNKDVESVDDVEYFLIDTDCIRVGGSNTIDGVADKLNRFAELKEQDEKDREELTKFFNENIKGHTEKEYKYGILIHDIVTSQKDYSWDNASNILERILDETNVSNKDKARAAFNLVSDCSYYSDVYKDTYGHRPRYYLD